LKGIPQKIKSYPGVDKYKLKMPTLTKVRAFEKRVREIGGKTSYILLIAQDILTIKTCALLNQGFLHTYCDVTSTEEEFLSMFDHSLWSKMREKYAKIDGRFIFPTIYEKVRPEVDIEPYLQEELAWVMDE
jgi:hypothetical protein